MLGFLWLYLYTVWPTSVYILGSIRTLFTCLYKILIIELVDKAWQLILPWLAIVLHLSYSSTFLKNGLFGTWFLIVREGLISLIQNMCKLLCLLWLYKISFTKKKLLSSLSYHIIPKVVRKIKNKHVLNGCMDFLVTIIEFIYFLNRTQLLY